MPRFNLPSRRLYTGKHRLGFTVLLFFLGVPLFLLSAWVLSTLSHRSGKIPHTGAGQWPIRFNDLKPGERILIDLQSSGCRDFSDHRLLFDGTRSEVTVILKSCWPSGDRQIELPKILGEIPINTQELTGLDQFLDLIRVGKIAGTSLDTIRIIRYCGDVLMASEEFSDGSSLEHAFEEDDKGKIVFSDRDFVPVPTPRSNELLSLGMIIRQAEKQAEQEANKTKASL